MNKMKRIISLFAAIIIMIIVCETKLTTVKAINSNSLDFSFKHIPNTPESVINNSIIVDFNECDLTISRILNCKVVVTVPRTSPITIYSTGKYHIPPFHMDMIVHFRFLFSNR